MHGADKRFGALMNLLASLSNALLAFADAVGDLVNGYMGVIGDIIGYCVVAWTSGHVNSPLLYSGAVGTLWMNQEHRLR
jgi:hypothetical protein